MELELCETGLPLILMVEEDLVGRTRLAKMDLRPSIGCFLMYANSLKWALRGMVSGSEVEPDAPEGSIFKSQNFMRAFRGLLAHECLSWY